MAAAQAVLNYLDGNNMLEHTRDMGEKLRNEVRKLMATHPQIGDVRGAGLFTGIEIVQPGTAEPDRPLAVTLIEKMRENNVLISLCGPYGNVLKVRPPLVFDATDLDIFISALNISLTAICE
jgi:4-aminobutyrate aminotransferase-like enzyme